MATAKQQRVESEYSVTLKIKASKLETMADAAKKIGVEVRGVEKIISTAPGEWATKWVEHERYMKPVLLNTDGRIIQRFEVKNEEGTGYIPGEYTYRTLTAYGSHIADTDTLDEAEAIMVHPVTQAEMVEYADEVAEHVAKYGTGDHEDAGIIQSAARSYLMGRGLDVPEEENGEEEGNRRTPEYLVTLRIKASTLPAVEKKAKAAFGDKLKSVEKVQRGFSRADDLDAAEEHMEAAKEIVGGLKDDMESWRDNTPDSLQGGEKYSEVEECVSNLESLESDLESISFEIDFPGMF
jgi:hypothetical protein